MAENPAVKSEEVSLPIKYPFVFMFPCAARSNTCIITERPEKPTVEPASVIFRRGAFSKFADNRSSPPVISHMQAKVLLIIGAFMISANISLAALKNVMNVLIESSAAPLSATAEQSVCVTAIACGDADAGARTMYARRRGALKISSKAELTVCAASKIAPSFALPNIFAPTAPTRNAAPALFVKGSSELASLRDILPEEQSSAAADAPAGYPHISPVSITVIPDGDTPKKASRCLHFENISSLPLFAISFAATININREGIAFSVQSRSPFFTDLAVSAEK